MLEYPLGKDTALAHHRVRITEKTGQKRPKIEQPQGKSYQWVKLARWKKEKEKEKKVEGKNSGIGDARRCPSARQKRRDSDDQQDASLQDHQYPRQGNLVQPFL